MHFQNKFQKIILELMPYFRGSWLLYSNFFKLLPYKWRTLQLDENIIVDLSDPPQFSIVTLRKGKNEPAATNFIKRHLKEGDVFIDVGANWGYFTCLASKIVGKNGLVISIEPVRKTFIKLLDTISRNRIFNVLPFNIAAGENFGELVNFIKPWYRQSTSTYMTKTGKKGTILTNTLDWIAENIEISSRNLKIIKIDVEGTELFVLKGAISTLKKYKPIVIIEIGDECMKFGYNSSDTYKLMESLGYKPLYYLDNDGNGEIRDYMKKPEIIGQIVFGIKK